MHPTDSGTVIGGGAAWFAFPGSGGAESPALVVVSNHAESRMGLTGRMG